MRSLCQVEVRSLKTLPNHSGSEIICKSRHCEVEVKPSALDTSRAACGNAQSPAAATNLSAAALVTLHHPVECVVIVVTYDCGRGAVPGCAAQPATSKFPTGLTLTTGQRASSCTAGGPLVAVVSHRLILIRASRDGGRGKDRLPWLPSNVLETRPQTRSKQRTPSWTGRKHIHTRDAHTCLQDCWSVHVAWPN